MSFFKLHVPAKPKKGDVPHPRHAKILLGTHGVDGDQIVLGSTCATRAEFEHQIDRLRKDLDALNKAGLKHFRETSP